MHFPICNKSSEEVCQYKRAQGSSSRASSCHKITVWVLKKTTKPNWYLHSQVSRTRAVNFQGKVKTILSAKMINSNSQLDLVWKRMVVQIIWMATKQPIFKEKRLSFQGRQPRKRQHREVLSAEVVAEIQGKSLEGPNCPKLSWAAKL